MGKQRRALIGWFAVVGGLVVVVGFLAAEGMLPWRLLAPSPFAADRAFAALLGDIAVAERAKDDRRALDLYSQALADRTHDWALRGILLKHRAEVFERLQQYDEAEADWTARLTTEPRLPVHYAELGFFHLRRKAFDRALTDFRAALALDPKDESVAEQIKALEGR